MKTTPQTQEEWEEAVKTREASMYIKPTRYKHSSGFRTFEVGYCTIDGNNKVNNKLVLRTGSDHIHTDFKQLYTPGYNVPINMDLTLDGYIRMWGSSKHVILWENMPMSSAEIISVEREPR